MHTPGPWFNDATYVGSTAVDRFFITCHNKDLPNGREEAEANARLIAAAPDLLEALHALVSSWETGTPYTTEIGAARAAIARATGGKA